MKLFNLLLVFLFVIYILIFIYNFLFAPTMIGGRKYKIIYLNLVYEIIYI